jgi:DivIVA domain-containing protein
MSNATPDSPSAANAAPATAPEFEMVRRGYDPGQVRAYLRLVADRVQMLEAHVRQLGSELDEARRRKDEALAGSTAGADPYEAMSVRLADLMRTFDADVARLRGEAQTEADRIVAEAKAEGDRTRADAERADQDARAQAERLVREAREEADRVVSSAKAFRETAMDEFRAMRDRMLKSARALEALLEEEPSERVIVLEDADESSPWAEKLPTPPEIRSDLPA